MSGTKRLPPQAPRVGAAFLVSQVGAHAAASFGARLAPHKLKPHDAGILRLLNVNPGLSQRALCDLLGMFPSRLVGLLDRLERRQLIERRESPTDRRRHTLHLTKSGRAASALVGTVTRELEESLFASLTHTETEWLREVLTRVVTEQRITPGVHPAYRQLGTKGART